MYWDRLSAEFRSACSLTSNQVQTSSSAAEQLGLLGYEVKTETVAEPRGAKLERLRPRITLVLEFRFSSSDLYVEV